MPKSELPIGMTDLTLKIKNKCYYKKKSLVHCIFLLVLNILLFILY